MFVKTKAYLIEVLFKYSTPGKATLITHERWTMLVRPARDKHPGLSKTFINYVRKKLYNVGPCWQSINDGEKKVFFI
jgi:hypothetical protein